MIKIDLTYYPSLNLLYLDYFANLYKTQAYDEYFYGAWSSRIEEINFIKGLPHALLCIMIRQLIVLNIANMSDTIRLDSASFIGLVSFNFNITKRKHLIAYYNSIGFTLSEEEDALPLSDYEDIFHNTLQMESTFEIFLSKCSKTSSSNKYIRELNYKDVTFSEGVLLKDNPKCTIL